MSKIAVMGVGAMGSRMAARWLDAGHAVTVFNRSRGRVDPLVAAGATAAVSAREAAAQADVVVSMVTDDDAAHAVWLDPSHGALAAVRPGAVVVESSTVTPQWPRTLAEQAARVGVEFVEAPVAGSRPQAEQGQLIVFAGGEAAALRRVEPILRQVAGTIHHVGPVGRGAQLKLAINTSFAAQVVVLAELLQVLEGQGLPPADAMEVLGGLPVTSAAMRGVGALIAADRHAPMFPIDLVVKDLRYFVAQGEGTAATPAARCVLQRFEAAAQAGLGEHNITAIARWYGHAAR